MPKRTREDEEERSSVGGSHQPGEEWLPVLDVGPLLAGRDGALEQFAKELRLACEGIGFYFLENFEVLLPEKVIADMQKASIQAHSLPHELKETWWLNKSDSGFLPVGASTRWGSKGRPPLPENEGSGEAVLFWGNGPPWVAKEDQLASFSSNHFLDEGQLPGFRTSVGAYLQAIESLARALLPAYALALEQESSFFDNKFDQPCWALRLNHYPPTEAKEIGIPPHADGDFCTFLLQDDQPGLSVLRSTDNKWMLAPARGSHSLLVNSGNSLMRLSNGRFPSTMHTASCISTTRARFSVPFFWSPSVDVVIEPLPAFITADNPAQYNAKESGNVYSSGRVGFAVVGDPERTDVRAFTFEEQQK